MPRPNKVSISVSGAARTQLRTYAAQLSGHHGRFVTLDEALREALRIATNELTAPDERSQL